MSEITFARLTPARINDFFRFFDHDAFCDNPDWSACYCYFFLADSKEKEWPERSGTENREAMHRLIEKGKISGCFAYDAGKVVGWCHCGPRSRFPLVLDLPNLPDSSDETIGSIVCFVIASDYRRQGLSRRLLDEACLLLHDEGYSTIEVYPRKTTDVVAENYHGYPEMYLNAGFSVVAENEDFQIMRK